MPLLYRCTEKQLLEGAIAYTSANTQSTVRNDTDNTTAPE